VGSLLSSILYAQTMVKRSSFRGNSLPTPPIEHSSDLFAAGEIMPGRPVATYLQLCMAYLRLVYASRLSLYRNRVLVFYRLVGLVSDDLLSSLMSGGLSVPEIEIRFPSLQCQMMLYVIHRALGLMVGVLIMRPPPLSISILVFRV
jgi:hypothetical protein